MKKKELIQDSIRAVTEYYKGNLEPFFEYISDDILWFGPRSGQMLRGRDNVIKAWSAEETDLKFSMGTITADSTATGQSNLEVLLEYYVCTHFPGGEVDRHHQRIHYSWGYRTIEENGRKKRVPKICMIHISNITAGKEMEGTIYASSSAESGMDALDTRLADGIHARTLCGTRGEDEVYYFNSTSIMWVESTDSGRHSIFHTMEGTYKTMERVRDIEKNFSGILLRAHTSYLVNPLYVRSVRRFAVLMSDGTELPVPQKKYTAFRRKLESWNRDPKADNDGK